MDKYIKRSEVIGLVEKAIKKCSTEKTAKGVLVCANLRTAIMGLRSASVAPREEVYKQIAKQKAMVLDVIDTFRNLLCIESYLDYEDTRPHYCVSIDDVNRIHAELKKKYTEAEPEPPKSKQPKCSENFEKQRLLPGDCFHGEIWYRCPYCLTGIEAHSIPKDRICHKCGKEYL